MDLFGKGKKHIFFLNRGGTWHKVLSTVRGFPGERGKCVLYASAEMLKTSANVWRALLNHFFSVILSYIVFCVIASTILLSISAFLKKVFLGYWWHEPSDTRVLVNAEAKVPPIFWHFPFCTLLQNRFPLFLSLARSKNIFPVVETESTFKSGTKKIAQAGETIFWKMLYIQARSLCRIEIDVYASPSALAILFSNLMWGSSQICS